MTTRSDASLSEMLHARALASPPRRLGLDVALGALIAVPALWIRPKGWIAIASAGLCLVTYGVWAFAERHLESGVGEMSRWTERSWRVGHGIAAFAGVVAMAALLFALLGLALGTWIS